jgi:hypothetical protein
VPAPLKDQAVADTVVASVATKVGMVRSSWRGNTGPAAKPRVANLEIGTQEQPPAQIAECRRAQRQPPLRNVASLTSSQRLSRASVRYNQSMRKRGTGVCGSVEGEAVETWQRTMWKRGTGHRSRRQLLGLLVKWG